MKRLKNSSHADMMPRVEIKFNINVQFIVSCQGNLRFQLREELALAPPGQFFCIISQSCDWVKLCLKLYSIEIVSTKLLTMRFGAQSIGNQFWSVQSPQKLNGLLRQSVRNVSGRFSRLKFSLITFTFLSAYRLLLQWLMQSKF